MLITPLTNCEVVSVETCIFCKKGYRLSLADNQCYSETPEFCTSNDLLDVNKLYGAYAFKMSENGAGCNKCDSGHTLIQFNDLPFPRVCVERPIETHPDPLIPNCDGTAYIYNLIEDRWDCRTCTSDYLLAEDGQCALSIRHPNCLLAKSKDESICVECESTYSSVSGKCRIFSNEVANCEVFADSSNSEYIICEKCNDGFYIYQSEINANHQCIEYSTMFSKYKNCAVFDATDFFENDPDCIKCMDTYALIILEGGVKKCFPNIGSHCSYDISDQNNGVLRCGECFNTSTDEVIVDYPIANRCLMTEIIDNCSVYNVTPSPGVNYDASLSTLECDECLATHFLTTTGCELRDPYPIPNCAVHALSSNTCEVCEVNFFLEENTCISLTDRHVTPAPQQGHILNCTPYKECNREVYFDGLDAHVKAVTSCHQCRNLDQIPFSFIRGG